MSDLDKVFYWRGISDTYFNYKGEHTPVPTENRLVLLKAMGVDVSNDTAIRIEALNLDFKPWLNWLVPLTVVELPDSVVPIRFKQDELFDVIKWSLLLDGEEIISAEFKPADLCEMGEYHHQGERFSCRALPLGELAPEYYELSLSSCSKNESGSVAIAPKQSHQLTSLTKDRRLFGFIVQLYTLKSESNWGIGDFSNLAELIEFAAENGVDVLGVNPFHALQPNLNENYSPYSPSDRRFINPLYIDVELVPGFDPDLRPDERLEALRKLEHIDYANVKKLKYECLYSCFENYISGSTRSLASYIKLSTPSLMAFANFEVANTWQSRNAVAMSISRDALIESLESSDKVLPIEMYNAAFHCFLQWVADTQLQACQDLSIKLGMAVGLIRDLAVGASGACAEVKTNEKLFCETASIGAPPDPLALTGQNWGVPPMDPTALRASGFKHFRELLRTNMARCGALRIDHAMCLYRLWWCPPEANAEDGAYVYYPFSDLMGILCLESFLNKTAIIAEDMGVVPEEFREEMARRSLLGNRVFYFEKWQEDVFKSPQEYDEFALAMTNNHDVATLTSWWNETDLVLRSKLDMLEKGSTLEQVLELRRREKRNLLLQLANSNALPDDWNERDECKALDWPLMDALICHVANCRSKIFVLQLEDLLMMNDPVNVPGTHREHENWSRKLNKNLTDIFSDKRIGETIDRIQNIRSQ